MQELCLSTSDAQKAIWKERLASQLEDLKTSYRNLLYGGSKNGSRVSGTVFRSREDANVFFAGNNHKLCYRYALGKRSLASWVLP